jgi:hypothetical protein
MNARNLMPMLALIVVGTSLPVSAQPSSAQPSSSRFAAGGQISALRLGGALDDASSGLAGFGGHLTYDMGRWVTLEGEVDFFPNDRLKYDRPPSGSDFRLTHHRRRLEGFVGPKVGLRMERFGVFGKVRPGFSRLMGRGVDCVGVACAYINYITPTYKTDFALDLGAVLEFYPSSSTIARVDLGDTMVRQNSQAPPCRGCTTHNFSPRVGFGFRF